MRIPLTTARERGMRNMSRMNPDEVEQPMVRNVVQPWHLVILIVVALAVFGSKRLPDAARGLGRSMRILKSEVRAMKDDESTPGPTTAPETASTTAPGTVSGTAAPGSPPQHSPSTAITPHLPGSDGR